MKKNTLFIVVALLVLSACAPANSPAPTTEVEFAVVSNSQPADPCAEAQGTCVTVAVYESGTAYLFANSQETFHMQFSGKYSLTNAGSIQLSDEDLKHAPAVIGCTGIGWEAFDAGPGVEYYFDC